MPSSSLPTTASGRFAALTVEHLEAVAAIERQSFANPWLREELAWVVQQERSVGVGLWVERELSGYGLGQMEGLIFHLASLAIAPSWRRQGWGSRLLEEMLDQARQRGARGCGLEVRAGNGAAIELYRRWGFGPEGSKRDFYTRPIEDALIMYRKL